MVKAVDIRQRRDVARGGPQVGLIGAIVVLAQERVIHGCQHPHPYGVAHGKGISDGADGAVVYPDAGKFSGPLCVGRVGGWVKKKRLLEDPRLDKRQEQGKRLRRHTHSFWIELMHGCVLCGLVFKCGYVNCLGTEIEKESGMRQRYFGWKSVRCGRC